MPATFKVLIGIEQIWLMVELMYRIDEAMGMLNHSEGSNSDVWENSESSQNIRASSLSGFSQNERRISRGRRITTVTSLSYLALMLFCLMFIDPTPG